MRVSSKKRLAAVLAVFLLLPMASCAAGGETKEETESVTQAVTEAETTDPNYTCELPGDLNYNGTEVTVLFVKKDGRADELPCEKLGLGTISDAVYERNVAVENQLSVKLKFQSEDTDETASSSLRTMVQAGDKSIQISSIGSYYALSDAVQGFHLDLNRLDFVDTSKHYWSQEYNEITTFTSDNMQFLATSPAALSLFRLTYLTIYNRDLFRDRGLSDLYEVVGDGRWTLDYQHSLVADAYHDADGDGRVSEGDFFGFITGDTISVDAYTVASGIRFIDRDETGEWVGVEGFTDRTLNMADKVSALYNVQGTYVYSGASYDDIGQYYIIDKFAAGEGLMATTQFLSIERRIQSLADVGYGIVPMPKLNVEQDKYHTYVQDQISGFGVSSAIGPGEQQDMLGAVMESIAYHSYKIVRPAYYDSTLSLRFMQDPQSGEILDMMFETISFDRACTCFSVNIRGTMRDRLPQSNPALASQLKAIEKSIKNALKSEQRALDKLNK